MNQTLLRLQLCKVSLLGHYLYNYDHSDYFGTVQKISTGSNVFRHGSKSKIQLRKDQNRSVNCNKLCSNLTFFRNLMNHGGIEDYCNGRMTYVCVCM